MHDAAWEITSHSCNPLPMGVLLEPEVRWNRPDRWATGVAESMDLLLVASAAPGWGDIQVTAHRRDDGSVVWERPVELSQFALPSLVARGELVLVVDGGSSHAVTALDLATGEVRWRSPELLGSLTPCAGADPGTLVMHLFGHHPAMVTLDLGTGQVAHHVEGQQLAADEAGQLAVDRGRARLFDPGGELLWSVDLAQAAGRPGADVSAEIRPIALGCVAAVPVADTLVALDRATGELAWRAAAAPFPMATPCDEVVVINTMEGFAAFAADGSRRWMADGIGVPMSVTKDQDGTVTLFGPEPLLSVDAATGRHLGQRAAAFSGLAHTIDAHYLLTDDDELLAFTRRELSPLWASQLLTSAQLHPVSAGLVLGYEQGYAFVS